MTASKKRSPQDAIEVVGGPIGVNKGDDLMYDAVAENLGTEFRLGFSRVTSNYEQARRPEYGNVRRFPSAGQLVLAVRQRSAGDLVRYGKEAALLTTSEVGWSSKRTIPGPRVSAVVDCSGYAYGDPWSTRRTVTRAAHYRKARRRGERVIMLPQAFGPFTKADVAAATRAMLEEVDVVYARDADSYAHVAGLGLKRPDVRVAPDITHLTSATPPASAGYWRDRVCLVPNMRMIDKVDRYGEEGYVGAKVAIADFLSEAGVAFSILLHEDDDIHVARKIVRQFGKEVDVISGSGRELKGMIGASRAVVGSRFHALLSALAQGVPAVGTSWSHKYEALFKEYAYERNVVTDLSDRGAVLDRVASVVDPERNESQRVHLRQRAETQRQEATAMFGEVARLVRSA